MKLIPVKDSNDQTLPHLNCDEERTDDKRMRLIPSGRITSRR